MAYSELTPEQQAFLMSPPVGRAAYSDRTAWLMAQMSRLAYEPFERKRPETSDWAERLLGISDPAAVKKLLEEFLEESAGHQFEDGGLAEQLDQYGFKILALFDKKDTQVFLAVRDDPEMVVLAFRGTEGNSKADILSDLDLRFVKTEDGKVHRGFLTAFEQVAPEIREALKLAQVGDRPIYITGHSLGGALAIIAAKELESDQVAACYTFGSPKVGDQEFGTDIKPPVYRLVNSADLVPRVPPTWLFEILHFAALFIPVPWVRGFVVGLLNRFRGYRHHGDMRYLASMPKDQVLLIPNLNVIWRAVRLVKRAATSGFSVTLTDHKISNYIANIEKWIMRSR